jgi:hypothetical protein
VQVRTESTPSAQDRLTTNTHLLRDAAAFDDGGTRHRQQPRGASRDSTFCPWSGRPGGTVHVSRALTEELSGSAPGDIICLRPQRLMIPRHLATVSVIRWSNTIMPWALPWMRRPWLARARASRRLPHEASNCTCSNTITAVISHQHIMVQCVIS